MNIQCCEKTECGCRDAQAAFDSLSEKWKSLFGEDRKRLYLHGEGPVDVEVYFKM